MIFEANQQRRRINRGADRHTVEQKRQSAKREEHNLRRRRGLKAASPSDLVAPLSPSATKHILPYNYNKEIYNEEPKVVVNSDAAPLAVPLATSQQAVDMISDLVKRFSSLSMHCNSAMELDGDEMEADQPETDRMQVDWDEMEVDLPEIDSMDVDGDDMDFRCASN